MKKSALLSPARLAQRGFTLIELLVVIGILVVLLAITLVAINPAKQFAQADNTQRRNDVNAILDAVTQYAADTNGDIPAGITDVPTEVSTGGVDLCAILVSEYLAALPVDPDTGEPVAEADCSAAYATGYNISVSATNNRVTVASPNAELEAVISVTR